MAGSIPISERFKGKYSIDSDSGCWLWNASIHCRGYGQISSIDGPKLAHRVSYELHVGEIPEGLFVCHRCDVRNCVNPEHLFLGTNYDNVQDMVSKGRVAHGEGHYLCKFTDVEILEIKELTKTHSQHAVSRMKGVSQPYISQLVNNIRRASCG